MTGWTKIDAMIEWVRTHPVKFFLGSLMLYWLACMWGY